MTFTPGTPDLQLIYLLEIEVGHRIDTDTWTQGASPNTNAWYIAHAEGKPSKVEQDGAAYTEKNSLADCHGTASTWYWDAANSRLYVHASGSDDPGGGSYVIMSFIWEYYSNDSEVVYNSKYYLPYLDSDSVPSVKLATSGYHQGGTIQTFGSIKLINADGYFDARLSSYVYEAKQIIFKVGKKGNVVTDFATFWNGWTGNIGWTDNEIEVDIEDLRRTLP